MRKTNRLTLISCLAALAVVGRVGLRFIPNVQPVTAIIILSGYFLGPGSAILLAVVSTYISNLLLGMGIWTIWQIVAWVMIAGLAGIIKALKIAKPLFLLIILGCLAGFIYGLFFSIVNYLVTGSFWPYYFAGLPFDLTHAISNVIFILILYKPVQFIFKQKVIK